MRKTGEDIKRKQNTIQALNNENNVKKLEKEVRMNLPTTVLFNNFLKIHFSKKFHTFLMALLLPVMCVIFLPFQ